MENLFDKNLEKYVELLMSWVGKIRLTGTQDADGLREHVADALAAVPYLPENGKIIDVGTGGGLPGLVWAIARQDIKITLLDSIRKKCAAVESMRDSLGLKNASVVCARAEEYAKLPKIAGSFDIAAARAVAAAPKLASWLAPFVKRGGTALAFKGPKFSEEIAGLDKNFWSELNLSPPKIIPYGNRESVIVLWTRVKKIEAELAAERAQRLRPISMPAKLAHKPVVA